jgi:sulfur-carrier protein
MQVIVHIPASLRDYSRGERTVCIECERASTVGETFARVRELHPGVIERALDESGNVRPHVNVFVDGESIRAGAALGLETPVAAGTEVWILPAASGG